MKGIAIVLLVAALVIYLFSNSVTNNRARAQLKAIETVLESVLEEQDHFREANGRYTEQLDSLDAYALDEVEVSILEATAGGFVAVGYNPTRIPGYGCVVYRGDTRPASTNRGTRATEPGVVACDDATGAEVRSDR